MSGGIYTSWVMGTSEYYRTLNGGNDNTRPLAIEGVYVYVYIYIYLFIYLFILDMKTYMYTYIYT